MSPRAACRLEELGFEQVFDYKPSKADWSAAGLPVEGTAAQAPRVVDRVRRDVPQCGPDETIGTVRARLEASGWGFCVVTDRGIVTGLLTRKDVREADEGARADDVMRPGPSTWRANVPAEQMARYMVRKQIHRTLVTTPDGVLVGALLRDDLADLIPQAG